MGLYCLQAMDCSGICYDDEYHKFELVLARHLWKTRAEKLLGTLEKPTLHEIQRHLEDVWLFYVLFSAMAFILCVRLSL